MNEKVNLAAKLALLDKPYEPGIVGFINDYKLQVVKVKGPFVGTSTTRPTTSFSFPLVRVWACALVLARDALSWVGQISDKALDRVSGKRR